MALTVDDHRDVVLMSPASSFWGRSVSPWLIAVAVAWLVLGAGALGIDVERWWFPRAVTVLSWCASGSILWFALRPHSTRAYRIGGSFGVGALLVRIASLALRAENLGNEGTGFIVAVCAVYALLGLVYIRWWLSDVAVWHLKRRSARAAE